MKIVFVSNFLNHHQLPLCDALLADKEVEFTFIATQRTPDARLRLGYIDMNRACDFVICTYSSKENKRIAKELCKACDVLIIGSAPIHYMRLHLQKGQTVFIYSERIFKEAHANWITVARTIKYSLLRGAYKRKYLLSASAYAAADYAKTGNFINRAYKWGYFPALPQNQYNSFIRRELDRNITLVWVGRLIGWKHPEASVYVAERLKDEGYSFQMNVIGTGTMDAVIQDEIDNNNLGDCVRMFGAISADKVRECMEQSKIFLFTSDSNEGWGAVLSEAMSSGCAVVASRAIGSAPYLVKENQNGLLFQSENWDDLYAKVKFLIDNPKLRYQYGEKAYCTMNETWNAKIAAERLIRLAECLKNGKDTPYSAGPCSIAPR